MGRESPSQSRKKITSRELQFFNDTNLTNRLYEREIFKNMNHMIHGLNLLCVVEKNNLKLVKKESLELQTN